MVLSGDMDMWCPFVRVELLSGKVVNRNTNGDILDKASCVTDECMMWRWNNESDDNNFSGFCGLAGRPSFCSCTEKCKEV